MRLTPKALFRFAMPKQGKPMAYPYTWLSRWSQWNVVYEFRNNHMFRFSIYGLILMTPLILTIDRAVNSPEYVANYKKAKKLDQEKDHLAHMWKDIEGPNANR